MKNQKNLKIVLSVLAILIVLNLVGKKFYKRFDLTHDKRYTLSEASVAMAKKIQQPVIIDVLLEGSFPPEFRKLQTETRQMLEEFSAVNNLIKYNFVDPMEGEVNKDQVIANLQGLGLTPASVTVQDGSKVSQEFLFPWAMVNMGDQTVRVSLLKNKLGASSEERINNSVQQLEYAFADAFSKLGVTEKKKIAVLRGNGELPDIYMADFLSALREHYNIAPFTLDSVERSPQKTLDQLLTYDLAIIAKPTERFSDTEKQVMDQYTMHGGKSIWMIDKVAIELDSLFNPSGKSIALPRDLNLSDMFFKYGVRINPVLINDLYFTQIVLAIGDSGDSQYNPVPWVYAPMVFSQNNHPITNNIEALRFQFANAMDTLGNAISKTVLLTSSPLSKTDGVPREISLDIITQQPDRESYNDGNKPLAILLEGNFTSVYRNRVKPFNFKGQLDEGNPSKMIVISDGDVIKNQLNRGRPLELGYDKWTNNFYGNKEFLLNAVNYLLDDNGLINIRSKVVDLAFLDTEKVSANRNDWVLINLGAPAVFLAVFGGAFLYFRKQKYSR